MSRSKKRLARFGLSPDRPYSASRRRFLRGMLAGTAVTVGLPWLDVFLDSTGRALADGGAFPARFGLFFWGNGVLPDRWVPTGEGEGDAWELSEQLAPLAAFKSRLGVISGMEVKMPNVIPHHSGSAGILTGHPVVVKSHEDQTFAAPSIDQVVAATIGGATRFKSLELGAEARDGLSFNGPDNRNPPETEPMALFDRVFGAGFRLPGEDVEPDPKLALRRSVLDAVMEDAAEVKRDLGAGDRARLDQHLEGIRDLELRIARLEEEPPDLAACMRASEPLASYPNIEGRPQLREKNRALCDIVTMALACDQTRVFSNFITTPLNNLLLAGSDAGHHQLTHDEPGDQPQVNAIVKSIMTEFGYLVSSLDSVPEGDGSLLDNTVVLATSDISKGRTHSLDEFPILYAGSACGRLKTDVHYRSPLAENASKVLLSMVRAVGVQAPDFGGDEGYVDESLSAIEVT